jgi:hypothetical protein
MDCQCSCSDDGEFGTLLEDSFRVARKEHKCCECNRDIKIGEEYEYIHGLWDGEFNTFKTCLGCQRLRDDICSSYLYGELHQVVWDCFGADIITGMVREGVE